MERITELYIQRGRVEDQMSQTWIKTVVRRNLQKYIIKDLGNQLKDVKITNEVRHIVNIYIHDYQTDMPRG